MTPVPQPVIETVIFDLGNVLIAVDETRALDRMAARTGKTRRELENYVMLTPSVNQLARGELSSQRFFEIVRQDTGFDGDFAEFAHIWSDIFEPIEPMIVLARRLKRQVTRLILSNTNAIHMDYVFGRFPIVREVEGLVLSHEVGLLKPDPRIYELTLQRFGLRAERAVFIDDIPTNVEGARAAGLHGIHYQNPDQVRLELTKLRIAGI
ncbi:MAG: HAD family phosphatase [Verrucomicrobiia bacterium]